MAQARDRRLNLDSLPNARDLGGLKVSGGVLTPHQVFRGASLATLTEADAAQLTQLGLTHVIDLRTEAEKDAQPNRLPQHVTQIHLDVFADSSLNIAAQMTQFMSNPAAAMAQFTGNDAQNMLLSSYDDLVNLPSAKSAYTQFFQQLADPAHSGATLFHCTAGKDRTGWGAAILLFALGADYDTVLADYLLTNEASSAALQPMIDQMQAHGLDPDMLSAVIGVREAYLDRALQLVNDQYGSLQAYLSDALGVTDEMLSSIQEKLVVSAI